MSPWHASVTIGPCPNSPLPTSAILYDRNCYDRNCFPTVNNVYEIIDYQMLQKRFTGDNLSFRKSWATFPCNSLRIHRFITICSIANTLWHISIWHRSDQKRRIDIQSMSIWRSSISGLHYLRRLFYFIISFDYDGCCIPCRTRPLSWVWWSVNSTGSLSSV